MVNPTAPERSADLGAEIQQYTASPGASPPIAADMEPPAAVFLLTFWSTEPTDAEVSLLAVGIHQKLLDVDTGREVSSRRSPDIEDTR